MTSVPTQGTDALSPAVSKRKLAALGLVIVFAGGLAPRALGEQFFVATAAANAVFWLLLGLSAALAFGRLARR